jgi:hypothetical protein
MKGLLMKARSVLSLVAFTLALNPLAHAQQAPQLPRAAQIIGAAAYVPMEAKQLANPQIIYANGKLMAESGLDLQMIIEKAAWAAPVSGETAGGYTNKVKIVFADGYGGIGLNGNEGNGRTFTVDTIWENKGGGITPFVSNTSEVTHRNGASLLPEGIHEAVWSNMLAEELPNGASRILAIIATGTRVGGPDGEPRVLIVREAPVRPAHFVINEYAEARGSERDKARIADSMKHIVNALPQPKNSTAITEEEKFRSGIMEMIDRQAEMHSYGWAHSLFHGGTSPSNAGLDGRALDFGTFQALDGYQKIRVIHDDGFNGETEVYKRDLLKNIRDSLVKTLPQNLLNALPTEQEWFERFDNKYSSTQRKELLRLAGAFNEFAGNLLNTKEGAALANLLKRIAEAGNEKKVEKWKLQGYSTEYFKQGTYNLGEILAAATSIDLDTAKDSAELARVLPNENLRGQFIYLYSKTFQAQRDLAASQGINAKAEMDYRGAAVKMRNKKMTSLFATVENEKKIWAANAEFKEKGNTGSVQTLIDQTIAENRRDFHDARPFTVVLGEKLIDGKYERSVFDAKTGKLTRELAPTAKVKSSVRGGSCKEVFSAAI